MAGSSKYYAVQKGFNPGIYQDSALAQKQLIGFKNAVMKGFDDYDEATRFLHMDGFGDYVTPGKGKGASAQTFYAVARGKVPGIYTSLADAHQQTLGFTGQYWKKCATLEQATAFMAANTTSGSSTPKTLEASNNISPDPEGLNGTVNSRQMVEYPHALGSSALECESRFCDSQKTSLVSEPNGSLQTTVPKPIKYYGVAKGRTPGVYMDLIEAKKQALGVKNSLWRVFKNPEDAHAFVKANAQPMNEPTAIKDTEIAINQQENVNLAPQTIITAAIANESEDRVNFRERESTNQRQRSVSPAHGDRPRTNARCVAYYAVARGLVPGIYTSGKLALKQTIGVRNQLWKKFDHLETAQRFNISHSAPITLIQAPIQPIPTAPSKSLSSGPKDYFAFVFQDGPGLIEDHVPNFYKIYNERGICVAKKMFKSYQEAMSFISNTYASSYHEPYQSPIDTFIKSNSRYLLDGQRNEPIEEVFFQAINYGSKHSRIEACCIGIDFGPGDLRNISKFQSHPRFKDSSTIVSEVYAAIETFIVIFNQMEFYKVTNLEGFFPKYLVYTSSAPLVSLLASSAASDGAYGDFLPVVQELRKLYRSVREFYRMYSELFNGYTLGFQRSGLTHFDGYDAMDRAHQLALDAESHANQRGI